MERARDKQREALERAAGKGKKRKAGEKKAKAKAKGKDKPTKGKAKLKGKLKGKKKSFDDESDDEYSSDSSDDRDALDGIDMQELMDKAMAGAKKSPLHSLCWWRIVLDEAHMIKTRSSQTANAAFSLIGIHRWALSGTPLQNRVGEFYSLVRFLRLDPMAFYYCRMKDCNCKSMHYRIHAGICEGCNHGGIHHYSHFNKYV
jgi:DNA repair protein RAD16